MIKSPFEPPWFPMEKIDSEQLLDQSFCPSTSMESSYPYETDEWNFLIHLLFKFVMGQVRRVQVPQLGCVAFVAGHLALRTGGWRIRGWHCVMSVLGVFFLLNTDMFFFPKGKTSQWLNGWKFAIFGGGPNLAPQSTENFFGFLCISNAPCYICARMLIFLEGLQSSLKRCLRCHLEVNLGCQ